jgi:hypothetical protein
MTKLFADMTNSELLEEVQIWGNKLSYHNAAEGTSYTQEATARDNARSLFWAAFKAAQDRGLNPNTKGMLL